MGSPRVGDKDFVNSYNSLGIPTARFIHRLSNVLFYALPSRCNVSITYRLQADEACVCQPVILAIRMDPVAHIPVGTEEESVISRAAHVVEKVLHALLPQDNAVCCLGSSHTPVGSGLFKFGLSQDWIAGGAYHHVCHATVVDSTIGLLRGFSGMDATDLDPKTALEAMIKKL